jgi:hypothetical protein
MSRSTTVMPERSTEPSSRPVATDGHRVLRHGGPVGRCRAVSGVRHGSAGAGVQQAGAQLQSGRLGEVGQPAVGRAGAGQADTELGHAEEAGQEGPHHVDGLDARQRESLGVAPDEAALNAEGVPVDLPAGDQPVHEPEEHGRHADHGEVVLLAPSCPPEWPIGQHERQDHNRDQPADAGQRARGDGGVASPPRRRDPPSHAGGLRLTELGEPIAQAG